MKYYLPKNLYANIKILATESHTSTTKQIINCLNYALKNINNPDILPTHIKDCIINTTYSTHPKNLINIYLDVPGKSSPVLYTYIINNKIDQDTFIKYLYYRVII